MPGSLEPTAQRETDRPASDTRTAEVFRPPSEDASDHPTAAGALHVVPHGDGWGIRRGDDEVERVFRTREDAFHNARAWADREDRWVIVHGNEAPLMLRSPP